MNSKKIKSLILLIIWMIFIFIMSSFNSISSSNQSNFIVQIISSILNINNTDLLSLIIRKLAHFTEYSILGVLSQNLIKNYNKKTYLAIIICIIYAITDEIHQIFVPGRVFQLLDIIIDTLGSLTGIYSIKKLQNKLTKKIVISY